jgi:circadian clock protein KaiC
MSKNKGFVKTGVEALDRLIGGFHKNSINLVVGGAGSGKTIMAVQFLVNGIKQGDNGLYITFEEKREKMFRYMSSFGWDLERYEKENKLVFLEYTPEQVKRLITEGGGEIENVIEKKNIKRLVIDSITSFTLLYQDELTKKEAALALFELMSKWNCTALLTSQVFDEEGLSEGLGFEVDSIILLYHVKKGGKRKRGIELLKMRGTPTPEKIFPVKISKRGLEVNTRTIAVI